jgi:hypothetical protein
MKNKTVIPQKKRGPPATGKGEPVVVRMHPPMLTDLDAWIAKQNRPFPTRPEAVRRLVKMGLKAKTPARLVSKPGRRLRAQELATKAIAQMIDPSAPPEEQAQRRRRLTKGPTEFRDSRVDLPRAKGK